MSMTAAQAVQQILADRRGLPPRSQAAAFAPANIALVKYWGKRNDKLNLPRTPSLSVSLGGLGTSTDLQLTEGDADQVQLNGKPVAPESGFARRLVAYLDLFRPHPQTRFHVFTRNTVPTAAGVASSASGFAALALALNRLFAWELEPRELSILARLGSGSASRSVTPGFVLWHAGSRADGMDSYAESLRLDWPSLRIGVLELSTDEKAIGSRPAMERTMQTSALYAAWPDKVNHDLRRLQSALTSQDLAAAGAVAESNALSMHATMLGAWPPILYWLPETVSTLQRVWQLRAQGLPLFATLDAGPNVKLLFEKASESAVRLAFPQVRVVLPFDHADPLAGLGTDTKV